MISVLQRQTGSPRENLKSAYLIAHIAHKTQFAAREQPGSCTRYRIHVSDIGYISPPKEFKLHNRHLNGRPLGRYSDMISIREEFSPVAPVVEWKLAPR